MASPELRTGPSLYEPRSRPERLIASGRVVLAASSLFAVWLDPSEPAKHAHIAYSLLAAYLAYAVVIALTLWRLEGWSRRGRIWSHAFDLVFFSLFIYFTAGPASPFIAFFVFSLVCATVRWGRRGTLWTAVLTLAVFLLLAVYFGEVLHDPAFQLDTTIIRWVYLAVVAVLLAYLGAHEERTRREMSQLAAWPQGVPREGEALVREVFEQASRILAARRLVLVWTERDEPTRHLASWLEGEFAWRRESPTAFEPPVPSRLAEVSFLCSDLRASEPSVRVAGAETTVETSVETTVRWRGQPLHADLRARFAPRSVLALRLRGELVEGRLFCFDKSDLTSDDLVLGEVVAGVATARLDHFYLLHRLHLAVATEERIRLARDLHDGVLQSLTGVALRLAAVRRLLDEDPAAAGEALADVGRLIALEQRDLRFFIEELRPADRLPAGQAPTLGGRLLELKERIEREWDLRLEIEGGALDESVGEGLGREIYHIVREAVVNAARHGEAQRVRVEVEADEPEKIAIRVEDDGRGFAFEGRYTGDALARMSQGPRSLRERVASLGGAMELESRPGGACIAVVLPRPPG